VGALLGSVPTGQARKRKNPSTKAKGFSRLILSHLLTRKETRGPNQN